MFSIEFVKEKYCSEVKFQIWTMIQPTFYLAIMNRQISLLKKLLISTKDAHEQCLIWSFQRKNSISISPKYKPIYCTCVKSTETKFQHEQNPSPPFPLFPSFIFQMVFFLTCTNSLSVLEWYPIVSFLFMPDLKMVPFHVQHYMLWERLKRGRLR
jgi:hypothetical protein